MIISASYKTDIPAFYGKWFMNRLEAGFCYIVNPYSRKARKISLKREDVDAFVFWTKNSGPFMKNLEMIHQKGYPFVIQYTINGYPGELECSVVDPNKSISYLKILEKEYGPRVAVWRYDTILLTSLTPLDFHARNFSKLAGRMRGLTDEVIVSFAQFYKKTRRNVELASRRIHFTWEDPEETTKIELLLKLTEIAQKNDMRMRICSQPNLTEGLEAASCIDIFRLSDIAGYLIEAKQKPRRPGCGCFASVDIGEYDTCPHGCIYCYAVNDHKLAKERYRNHDPASEFLFKPKGVKIQESIPGLEDKSEQEKRFLQMRLSREYDCST
ncbi:MAG: DUF1848 domain-containing protein [Candidatus Methanofastidiosia archaeon]